MIENINSAVEFQDPYSYDGNPLLKPANAKIEMTMEQVQEYVRCSEDIIYFIRNYVMITTLDHGKVKFSMWDFQENIAKTCLDERFVICKMPRQVGKTTTIAAVILWHVLFNEDYLVAILANKMDQAQEILDRIQMAYEHLPKWMQQGIVSWNKRSIALENGSKIISAGTSSSAIRGKTINLLYLDEFAHIDRNLQQKFFTSVYPVITSGKNSKVIITSTPNGYEYFAKIWHDANLPDDDPKRNSYHPISVHWSDIPGRDEEWKQETINNTSEEQFRQEYECEFLGSSDTLIRADVIQRLVTEAPITKTNNINIFEDQVPGHKYIISVDVARGVSGDFSAFVVVDITSFPYKVVATFRDNVVEPVVFPNYIDYASRKYNDAHILVEINDIGGQIADILNYELENENLMMVGTNGRTGQILGGGSQKPRFGVKTTPAVKRIGCFAFKGLVENDQLLIRDFDIIAEISTFISNGKTYEADFGNHDDLVMCLVIFSWATTQKYFQSLSDNNVRQQILDIREEQLESSLSPFGIVDDKSGTPDLELSDPFEHWETFDKELMFDF